MPRAGTLPVQSDWNRFFLFQDWNIIGTVLYVNVTPRESHLSLRIGEWSSEVHQGLFKDFSRLHFNRDKKKHLGDVPKCSILQVELMGVEPTTS